MKIYDDIDLLHHVAGADLFHVPFWLSLAKVERDFNF